MDRRLIVAALAVPFACTTAYAVDTVLVDSFNNGVVENTDSTPAFWTQRLSGALGTATESGGSVRLAAGGSQYPHSQIASGVNADFNFFRTPLVVSGSGLNFTSSTGSLNKSIFRLALSSRQLFDAAPTNPLADDSEYWTEDALALRIESGDNVPGRYRVALGIKENNPMNNTEYEGFQLFNFTNNSGATRPGPIRSFRLAYGAKFWDLKLTHDASPTNTTQVTAQFTGGVDQFLSNWHDTSDAGPVTGNSSVILQSQLNNAGGTELATAALDQFSVGQLRQGWQGASGANWSDPASWSDGDIFHLNGDATISSVPNFVGANVKFANAAAPTIVTVDLDQTVGAILFDSAQSFTVQPGGLGQGTLQMDTRWLANEITVLQGSHTIISPINTYSDLRLVAANPAGVVTLAGQVTGLSGAGTLGLSKSGPGTAQMLNVRFFNVSLDGGTLRILPGATNNSPGSASVIQNLTIAGGPATPNATLDLTNNALNLDYTGASPLTDVRQLLLAGATNGKGFVSSTATGGRKLGYIEGSLLPGGIFAGQTLDGSNVVVAIAIGGDANFSGSVNLDDFTALAATFGSAGVWSSGDFDYNGTVNLDDFTTLAANFGQSLANLPRASVPEPGAIGLAVGAMLGTLRRRRA